MTLPKTFRILAIPFSGPIPKRGTDGVDLDGEYFSPRTATALTPYSEVPVYFHHKADPLKFLRDARLGTATGWRCTERGWVADVTLDDTPQVELVRMLSDRIDLYGSTGSTVGGKAREDDGHITRWPVDELSLSPTPQNLFSVIYEGTGE